MHEPWKITRSEREQTQKTTDGMILFRWNLQNWQIYRDRKEIIGLQRPGTGGHTLVGPLVTAKGDRVSFWGDANVLELDCSDGCTNLWLHQEPLNCTLEKGLFPDVWTLSLKRAPIPIPFIAVPFVPWLLSLLMPIVFLSAAKTPSRIPRCTHFWFSRCTARTFPLSRSP